MITPEKDGDKADEASISASFMNNSMDDLDKIKEMWAFNLPCLLLVNGGRPYWLLKLRNVYINFYKDILINVRKSLAAGLVDLAKLIEIG